MIPALKQAITAFNYVFQKIQPLSGRAKKRKRKVSVRAELYRPVITRLNRFFDYILISALVKNIVCSLGCAARRGNHPDKLIGRFSAFKQHFALPAIVWAKR